MEEVGEEEEEKKKKAKRRSEKEVDDEEEEEREERVGDVLKEVMRFFAKTAPKSASNKGPTTPRRKTDAEAMPPPPSTGKRTKKVQYSSVHPLRLISIVSPNRWITERRRRRRRMWRRGTKRSTMNPDPLREAKRSHPVEMKQMVFISILF